jgi:hypothetical protein
VSLARSIAFATDRLVEPVEEMHRSIAGRWWRALGPAAKPIRATHDAIAGLTFGSIRLAAAVVGTGVEYRTGSSSPAAERTIAVVNGLWTDGPATPMTLRDPAGAPIGSDTDLAAAFPCATDRIVVLVHGLLETERVWAGRAGRTGLHQRLHAHRALTPVAVRYPSGRSIDESGSRLADLLDWLDRRWPVPVQSFALVGNSMGGLVIGRACEIAQGAGHRWISIAADVVTLGSPHQGTPVEKLVHAAALGLGVASSTRPLAAFLDRRSHGIKDLRYGAVTAEPIQPAARALDGGTSQAAGRRHFIAGVVTRDPGHPAGVLVGDLVVRVPSSTGGRRIRPDTATVLGGVTHFSLPDDPVVLETIIARLDPDTRPARSTPAAPARRGGSL